MQIIAIASGKGGVGKSFLAANLSICLAREEKQVILMDLDLGGSNLHTLLGKTISPIGMGSYVHNPHQGLEELIQQTDFENLSFIPGEGEVPGLTQLMVAQKRRLVQDLRRLEGDYLVIDLGAGSGTTPVDFFLIANHSIIVTTPTLTATLNAYLFLKSALFRILFACYEQKSKAAEYLEGLRKDGESLQNIYLSPLLETLWQLDPQGTALFQEKKKYFRPHLILNMMDDPEELQKIDRLILSVRNYLGVELSLLGALYQDGFQKGALNARLPLMRYKPESVTAQIFKRMAGKILTLPRQQESWEEESGKAQYRAVKEEAQEDLNEKLHGLEELLAAGALTQGDLVETVRVQQYEIRKLKRENRFLKKKILLRENGPRRDRSE